MSQRQLGSILGTPQSWVHNCEVGNRRVDLVEFCRWCEACGQDPASIVAQFWKPPRRAK